MVGDGGASFVRSFTIGYENVKPFYLRLVHVLTKAMGQGWDPKSAPLAPLRCFSEVCRGLRPQPAPQESKGQKKTTDWSRGGLTCCYNRPSIVGGVAHLFRLLLLHQRKRVCGAHVPH